MNKRSKSFLLVLISLSTFSFAQVDKFSYYREISGISDTWHKIELPEEVFGKLKEDLNDLRIVGINSHGDTIEAPYILKVLEDKYIEKEIKFDLINKSSKDDNYFFTFEIPDNASINEIEMDFQQKNFDWRINLSGSQDQQEWFSIVNEYRILSIQNELTDYHFTNIRLPASRYRFYLLEIKSESKPLLLKAVMRRLDVLKGNEMKYKLASLLQIEDRKNKLTIIDLDLYHKVPVSKIKLNVDNGFDFYRPITIQYLSDSFETKKGWKYQYTTLSKGILSSFENQQFSFNSRILKKLHIIISNHDNEPLKVNSCEVAGFVYELTARFNEEANYSLYYGNNKANKPNYDITHFVNQIPESISNVQLGEEVIVEQDRSQKPSQLFESKIWLWGIIIIIIIVLGYFSWKMIKNELSNKDLK